MSLDSNTSKDLEIANPEDSGNLYEDWLKSCSNDSPDRAPSNQTIIVNSAAQSYQGLFQNLTLEAVSESKEKLRENLSSNTTSPKLSFASPKEKFGSLLGLNKTCYASILEQQQESDKDEESTKLFCFKCCKNVYPTVTMRLKDLNFWESVRYFIDNIKCCQMASDLKEYHEYVFTCSVCSCFISYKPIINK